MADRLRYVGTWLSLVEHSLGVRGVGSSNLPVPTIKINYLWNPFRISIGNCGGFCGDPDSVLCFEFPTPRLLRGPLGHRVQRLYCPPLCFQSHVAVVLQHLPAEMAADCLNGGVRGLRLRQC